MVNNGSLTGKIALVSGASRGLGRATAVELAAAGAYVVCTARSTREAATQTEVDDLTLEGTLDAVTGRRRGRRAAPVRPHRARAGRGVAARRPRPARSRRRTGQQRVGRPRPPRRPGRRGGVGRVDGPVPGDAPGRRLLRLRHHDAHPPARDGSRSRRARTHHYLAHARAARVGSLRVEQGREEPARLRARLPPAGQGDPGDRGRSRLDAHRADAHPPHRGGAGRQDRDSPPRGPGDGRPCRRPGRDAVHRPGGRRRGAGRALRDRRPRRHPAAGERRPLPPQPGPAAAPCRRQDTNAGAAGSRAVAATPR